MSTHPPHKDYCPDFIGVENEVPLLNGGKTKYINLDNAASTPALRAASEAVNDFLNYYSSVHRGTGFKSQISTHIYEEARDIIMKFFGANHDDHICAFVKNTTEALNKLANRFPFTEERDLVITTGMEHHSNDLPWRVNTETIHLQVRRDGSLDIEELFALMEEHQDRLALVAITGGSNVTGFITPIHAIAEKAHELGAQILADCAQLAPHRKVDMRPMSDPGHLDYISVSGHKMYAPFGTGALIGRRDTFEQGTPDMVGGGVVEIVTLEDVVWADPPESEEAGSPNVVGAVAMAAAIRKLDEIGMDVVAEHEALLTKYALEKLKNVKGIRLFGDTNIENTAHRLGVIPFLLEHVDHFKLAAILGHEFGIGVRNGCFCAHPLILNLLQFTEEDAARIQEEILAGAAKPGMIRASFGLYNSIEDVDAFVEASHKISAGEYEGNYVQDKATGEYTPEGWEPKFERHFKI